MIGRVWKNHQIRDQIRRASTIPNAGQIFTPERKDGALKLHEYITDLHEKLGPIYKGQLGPVEAIFTNSPYHYREIFRLEGKTPKHFLPESWLIYNQMRNRQRGLLFMDGEEWLNYRRILNKLLLDPDDQVRIKIADLAAEGLTKSWNLGPRIISNLEKQLYSWSINVILGTLMGSRWTEHESQLSKEKDFLATNLPNVFKLTSKLSTVSATKAKEEGLPEWIDFVNTVDECFYSVKNLISKMINLQTDEDDGLLKSMINEGIRNENDLSSIVSDLIFASGDTTASTVSWTLYLLACNPDVQEEVYKEDLKSRELFLKGILKETLRLYPVAPFLTRHLPEDCVIDGYRIPKDDLIILSLCSSGRDAKNFPQPNEFLPRRWSRTSSEVKNPLASIPFAFGKRSCVGKKLAETQIISLLNKLIDAFKIDCPNKSRIKMILHLISVPSEPLKLQLTPR